MGNDYLYNGKEEQDELGLAWLDYGARMYMPEVGRMVSIDPHYFNYFSTSSYAFVLNNPTLYSDPTGMDTTKYSLIGPPQNPHLPAPTPPTTVTPTAPGTPSSSVGPTPIFYVPSPLALFSIFSLAVLMQGDTDNNGTRRLNDEEAERYFELLNKRDYGDGLSQSEEQDLYQLELKEEGIDAISGGW